MCVLWDWNNIQLYMYMYEQKNSTSHASEEHEAITNIIDSFIPTKLHAKKNNTLECCWTTYIQIHIRRIYRYIHMNQQCLFKQIIRHHLIGHLFEKLLYTCICIIIHTFVSTTVSKIIYPLFKDQLLGEGNSSVINHCPCSTGLCTRHVWYY